MKKILVQIDSDRAPSLFDAVAAYDSGVDTLVQYGGIEPGEVRDLVYGAMFTRGPADLKNTAIFIGGTDVAGGEALLEKAAGTFFGTLRVSVMLDSNGCNTTAAAAVVKVLSAGPARGKRIAVLAGTGPVGQRVAALLAAEGAEVTLTSRKMDRAEAACAAAAKRFGVSIAPAAASEYADIENVLRGAHAAVCTGVEGVMLIPETIWKPHPTLRALADVNAVPPLGIEGSQVHWDGEEVEGKRLFGAIGIGGFKMKVHKRCVARLFESNDLVLDAEEIMKTAKELA
jgi:hypothetical protein